MPSKKLKNKKISFKYKVWLENSKREGLLGEGKIDFLKQIDKEGSIQAAAKKTGISYRKAWDNLKADEEKLGFLIVEKHRGGSEGGMTVLTNDGKLLIKIYDELHKEFDKAFKKIILKFS